MIDSEELVSVFTRHAVSELRRNGYVVVIYSPTELDGVDPVIVEDSIYDCIDKLIYEKGESND
jgi:hypothetical protein